MSSSKAAHEAIKALNGKTMGKRERQLNLAKQEPEAVQILAKQNSQVINPKEKRKRKISYKAVTRTKTDL